MVRARLLGGGVIRAAVPVRTAAWGHPQFAAH
jgi:hypothetical protein